MTRQIKCSCVIVISKAPVFCKKIWEKLRSASARQTVPDVRDLKAIVWTMEVSTGRQEDHNT